MLQKLIFKDFTINIEFSPQKAPNPGIFVALCLGEEYLFNPQGKGDKECQANPSTEEAPIKVNTAVSR